jgi:hypothetical protein
MTPRERRSSRRTPTKASLATTSKKKKAKQPRKDPLVIVAKCKNSKAPPEGGPGVFDEMLDKACPYHRYPVKHTLKECGMMKCYFFRGA